MLQIQTVLFPTDFSAGAEQAFAHAVYFARRYGAALHVLNVVAPDGPESGHPPSARELENRTEAADDVPLIQHQVQDVSAAAAILAYTDQHDVDLIVMGTHGRRGIKRLMMGSTAEEVVRLAPCPVFTVRAQNEASAGLPTIQRILVPVDFSKFSRSSIRYAKELASVYQARIDLLHITEDAIYPTTYGIEPVPVPASDILRRSREALEALAEDAGVPAQVHAKAGHPAAGLLAFIEQEAVDLVVIATHGRTGIQRFLLGSVTEKVVRLAPCPVFTTKSFGKSLLA